MQNEEAMCYITYAVPARLMPNFPLVPAPVEKSEEEHSLFPTGFMPDWFLNGKFPEDEYDD